MHVLVEHQKKYLERRLTDIYDLKESLKHNNFDIAASIGHRLKGNGVTFGYPNISDLGIALEKAAIDQDKNRIKNIIDELFLTVETNLKDI